MKWNPAPDIPLKTPFEAHVREDGRVERICKHGVGHPVGTVEGVKWQEWMYVHGCDGCCSKWEAK